MENILQMILHNKGFFNHCLYENWEKAFYMFQNNLPKWKKKSNNKTMKGKRVRGKLSKNN